MADGRIEIKFDTDTKQIEVAGITVKTLGKDIKEALKPPTTATTVDVVESIGDGARKATVDVVKLGNEVEEVAKTPPNPKTAEGIEDIGDKAQKSTGGVKSLVTAMGLLKVAGVAVQAISRNLGDAVKRVDTMRSFPRMMQQVGFSAEETEQSIDKLSAGIDGLPTALDEVVSTTQQLALTTGDLGQATELTLALNNAFLASGSSGADASRGLQQFSQMLSSGKVDMQSWRTLLETMPLALQTVSENFGYTGASAKNDLYAALQDGTITFDDFTGALIEANNAQGGFAELAKVNSEGMATSWKNINTAVVKGVADVILALDELVEELSGKNIAQHFDSLKVVVGGAFSMISTSIRNATPYVQSSITMLQRLGPVIAGLATAYAALQIINTISSFWQASTTAIQAAEIATKGITLATKASAVASAAEAGALTVTQVAFGVLTGQIKLATVAKQLYAAASNLALGPVGLLVGALGLAAAAFWVMKDGMFAVSDEMAVFIEESDKVNQSAQGVIEEIGKTEGAFADQVAGIDAQAGSLSGLATRLDELTKKESLNNAEKELAIGIVDQLNSSVEGLALTYDSESNSVNMTSEALQDYISKRAEIERMNARVDRLISLENDAHALEAEKEKVIKQLEEVRDKREEIGRNIIKDGGRGEYNELSEQLTNLKETYTALNGEINTNGTNLNELEAEIQDYTMTVETSTEAVSESLASQTVSFSALSDEQKAVIEDLKAIYQEYEAVATNAMSKISTESEIGANTMLENLQHNQQAIKEYSENLSLIEEAAKDLDSSGAFMEYLRSLGPEAAGEIANLAEQLGTETDVFAELVSTFDLGAETAATAMATTLSEFELPEGSIDIITKVEEMLSQQIETSGLSEIGGLIMDEVVTGLTETPESLTLSGETVGQAFGDGAISGVASRKEDISASGTEGGQSAVTGFAQGGSGAYTAGEMLGVGLNNGLASMHTTVVNTAVAMANAAVQAINGALGVASPAKEGIYSGSMLGKGLVVGGESELGAIEDMGEKMATAAIPDFAGISLEQALNMPRFSDIQTAQSQSTQSSATGLESLGNKLDKLIAKSTDLYIEKDKVGGILSPTIDRNLGRESIFEERWG